MMIEDISYSPKFMGYINKSDIKQEENMNDKKHIKDFKFN